MLRPGTNHLDGFTAIPAPVERVVLPQDAGALPDYPISRWLAEGAATVVKQGTHRSVYRLDLPDGQFYLKHDHPRGIRSTLRSLLRGSPARREWAKSRELLRRQIPTIEALSYADVGPFGLVRECYLLTKGIPDSCSLHEYLTEHLTQVPAARQPAIRSLLVERLALLFADAHRAGLFHNDIHLGNILVSAPAVKTGGEVETDSLRLYLIDIPGVRLSRPLDWNRSRRNLAVLRACCATFTSRRDYLHFWRTYVGARPELVAPSRREVWQQLERLVAEHERRLHRSRDKRALQNNRDFRRVSIANARGHVVAEMQAPEYQMYFAEPVALLEANWHQPVRLTERVLMVEASAAVGGRYLPVAYRAMQKSGWWRRLWPFGRGRAVRLWRAGQALQSRGIPAPRPLFCIEDRSRGALRSKPAVAPGLSSIDDRLRCDSYLATAWLDGAVSLQDYLSGLSSLPPAVRRARVRQCAASLGQVIGRLHFWHLAHRDLSGSNLVVVERPEAIETYLVDWDRLRWPLWFRRSEAVRNLVRLPDSLAEFAWISRGDRLRFLRGYCQHAQLERGAWKSFWRKLQRRVR